MIKLSIIIPHYNSPDLLQKLLDSIPVKGEIQVIVIDDRSGLEVEKYSSIKKNRQYAPVLFLDNTGKKSAGTCRNIGLEKAAGKWILFADADDYFVEGFYEIVSEHFESENDVIFFLSTSIEIDTGNVSDRHIGYNKTKVSYNKNMGKREEVHLRYSIPSPSARMIKNDFIKEHKIAFDEVIASNDVMFSIRVGYHMRKFQVVEEVIYCITRSKGSLTTTINTEIIEARLKVLIDASHFLKKNIAPDEYKLLNITGMYVLTRAIKGNQPLQKILQICMIMIKNGIKPFEIKRILEIYKIGKVIRKIKEKDSRYFIVETEEQEQI